MVNFYVVIYKYEGINHIPLSEFLKKEKVDGF